jgi:hypothetical protein
LVETVILNYMALHGEQGNFQNLFPNTGLSSAQITSMTAFAPLSTTPLPPPPPPPPPVITTCSSSGASISGNHLQPHSLNVPAADLDSPTDKIYSIMGAATHSHSVTLTVAQLTLLKTGPVVVTSTTDDNPAHNHMVTVTCV